MLKLAQIKHGGVFKEGNRIGAGFIHGQQMKRKPVMASSPNFRFLLLLSGSGTFHIEGNPSFSVKPGMCIQRLGEKPHMVQRNTHHPWVEFYILIPHTLALALDDVDFLNNGKWLFEVDLDQNLVNKLVHEVSKLSEHTQSSNAFWLSKIIEIMEYIFSCRVGKKLKRNDPIEKACILLNQDFDQDCSIEDVATELGMGYEHFRKCFKDKIGCAPKEFRIQKRIEKAQSLLFLSDMTVEGIGAYLGYPDIFSFSRQFKKYSGLSPLKYRNQLA